MNNEIVELKQEDIEAVAGGFDDIPYCGTPWRRIPFPGPVVIPVIIIGPRPI